MKVMLVVTNPRVKSTVKDILVQQGIHIAAEATNAGEILRRARTLAVDLVILDIDLEGGRARQAAMVLEEDGIAPVLLLASEGDPETKEFPYVLKPVSPYSLVPAIDSTLLFNKKRLGLMKEVERLRDQLATRKAVEMAKGLIMKERGLTEEEAHRLMQKVSMEKGIPLKAVAEAIIALKNII